MEKEEVAMLSALVIEGNFQDLGDILKVARAEGQKKFHTRENVYVVRLIAVPDLGIHIAIVSDDKEFKASGLRGRNKK
ncbi:MAG: hypothetical protein ACE5OW_04045 [Candidatus Bathyarchaeia archaeon]